MSDLKEQHARLLEFAQQVLARFGEVLTTEDVDGGALQKFLQHLDDRYKGLRVLEVDTLVRRSELRQQIIVLCADLRKARREISELSGLRDQWLQRAQALEAKVAELQEVIAKVEATP